MAGDVKTAQQLFEKEVILTEKEKLRNRLITDKEGMKEVCTLPYLYLFNYIFNYIFISSILGNKRNDTC